MGAIGTDSLSIGAGESHTEVTQKCTELRSQVDCGHTQPSRWPELP